MEGRSESGVSNGSFVWTSHPTKVTESSREAAAGQDRAAIPPNDTALALLAWVVLLSREVIPAIAFDAMLIPADSL